MPVSTPFSRVFYIFDDATISPARAHMEREPSVRKRKRQRVDRDEGGVAREDSRGDLTDEEVEEQSNMGSSYNPLSFQRDPDYYPSGRQREDEIVVRVQRTLFKVPKSMLQNSAHLCVIGGGFKKTYTDLDPLEVDLMLCRSYDPATADQVEIFRSILWGINVLHGGDEALMAKTPATYEEVERILSATSVAKDFGISKWEAWAIHTAGMASNDNIFLDSCSSIILRLLIQVAASAKPPLTDIIARVALQWAERVRNKKAPSVPAILAAEAYQNSTKNPYVPEVRALYGVANYVYVLDMDEFQTFEKDGIVTRLRVDSKLTNEQAHKISWGRYSLERFWQHFRLKPSEITMAAECSAGKHARCNSVWAKRWKSAVGWERILRYNNADALGLLWCLKDMLAGDDETKAGMTPECRAAGLEMLEKKRDEVDKTLASHFLGCI